jgi:alpha-mannosidase
MEFITVTDFGRLLEDQHAGVIGTQRGDWTDHWADGVGSSAFEVAREPRRARDRRHRRERSKPGAAARAPPTGTRRSGRPHLRVDDAVRRAHLGCLLLGRGAALPVQPGAVEPQGRLRLYRRDGGPQCTVARAANALAAPLGTKGPEGIFNLGNLDPKEAFKASGIEDVLVFNTLPWERQVIVEEPEPRGGAAPVGVLDTFFNRRSTWGGPRPYPDIKRVSRARSRRWATPSSTSTNGVPAGDLKANPATPSRTAHYRVRIDRQDRRHRRAVRQGAGARFCRKVPGLGPGRVCLRDGRLTPTIASPSPISASTSRSSSPGTRTRPGSARPPPG